MGGMNSMQICSGSPKLIVAANSTALNDPWLGECPKRGEHAELGYAGQVPVHEPPRSRGRADEWLTRVQGRVAGVALPTARALAVGGTSRSEMSAHPP
jgi:hypothetical protein